MLFKFYFVPQYEDDWYILASKPDDYVFIYYKGNNDAWKGYGGATVYTRTRALDPGLIPELQAAAERAGLDWSKFTLTDNSCPAKPIAKGPLEELESDIEQAERFASEQVEKLEAGVEPKLRSFGRGFTVLEKEVARELRVEEDAVVQELVKEKEAAARLIKRFQMEAGMGKWVQWIPMRIREIIMPIF